jgi:hypothetical protein
MGALAAPIMLVLLFILVSFGLLLSLLSGSD